MPKTWAAAPGTRCHACGGTGPLVHHCDGHEGLHCLTCHDSWKISQITKGLNEALGIAEKPIITTKDFEIPE